MKTKQGRVWFLLFILSLIVLMLNEFVLFAQEPETGQGEADTTRSSTKTPTPEIKKFSATPLELGDAITLKAGRGVVLNEIEGASERATYIVQLAAPPVAGYQGGISGLAPTNPAIKGETKLDTTSSATIAYLSHLETRQAQFLTAAERTVGHSVGVIFDYQFAFNGVALRLTPQEAVRIAKLPGVRQVQRDFQRQLLTDFGPDWIGAPNIWDGSGTGGLPGT